MVNIIDSYFVQEMIKTTSNMYRLGWDERNGGNISYLLKEDELSKYLDDAHVLRKIPLNFDGSELIGRYFITTGSGKYFNNVKDHPEECLGIFRIGASGQELELFWGFENQSVPTSELPSHLMSHISRLKVDSENRIVMHCHATHLLAMTFTHDLKPREFTRTLWQMCTECLVVFPEGIEIIPWLVPGTTEIGQETARKMKQARLVIWPYHGVYGSGRTMDEAFGLIETAEKAAQIYTYVQAQGGMQQTISDNNLMDLAKAFGVIPNKQYLN